WPGEAEASPSDVSLPHARAHALTRATARSTLRDFALRVACGPRLDQDSLRILRPSHFASSLRTSYFALRTSGGPRVRACQPTVARPGRGLSGLGLRPDGRVPHGARPRERHDGTARARCFTTGDRGLGRLGAWHHAD